MRADSFFYSIADSNHGLQVFKAWQPLKKIAESSWSEAFEAFIAHENLLSLPYKSVAIGLSSNKYTLLPSRLYNPRNEKIYLEQVGQLQPNEIIKVDVLPFKARMIYALDKGLDRAIQKAFPKAYKTHYLSALTTIFQKNITARNEHQVFVHANPTELHVFVFEDTNLLIVNSFAYQTAKDFLYYILLIYQQFKLPTDIVSLRLTGQLVEDSEIFRLLYRYIKNVGVLSVPPPVKLGRQFQQQIPPHLHFDLLSLY